MIKLDLSDFSQSRSATSQFANQTAQPESEIEEIRLASFEAGYKAGLTDAAKMANDEQSALSDGLVQSIQDLSFTAIEAQTYILKSLDPFLEQLVTTTLPQIAGETLVPLVMENLTKLAADQVGQNLVVLASAENIAAIENSLPSELAQTVDFSADPIMGPTQVQISSASTSLNIDPTEAFTSISAIIQQYFSTLKEGHPNE